MSQPKRQQSTDGEDLTDEEASQDRVVLPAFLHVLDRAVGDSMDRSVLAVDREDKDAMAFLLGHINVWLHLPLSREGIGHHDIVPSHEILKCLALTPLMGEMEFVRVEPVDSLGLMPVHRVGGLGLKVLIGFDQHGGSRPRADKKGLGKLGLAGAGDSSEED